MRKATAAGDRALGLAALAVASAGLALLWLYGVAPGRGERAVAPAPVGMADGKAANHIAILGTSLTAKGSWVAEFEHELRSCNPEVAVTPLAEPGANSSWGLATLRAQRTDYDIVIVEFSINDASLFHGMPLFLSRERHRAILARIRETGAIAVLATMSPAWGWEAWERPGQASYREMYRDLAREEDVALIDTLPGWSALGDDVRRSLVPDNLHPTPDAMRQVTVPAFLTALRPAVCGGD